VSGSLRSRRAALVGVVEQADLGTPAFERHLQGLDRDMPIVHGTDGQPTTKRENKSKIAARYSLPLLPITNSVVSPTHPWFGASAANRRSKRFAATGWGNELDDILFYVQDADGPHGTMRYKKQMEPARQSARRSCRRGAQLVHNGRRRTPACTVKSA
jgi:hypothetical protein